MTTPPLPIPTPPAPPEIAGDAAPMSKYDDALLDAFGKDVAAQATRLDDLAKQLITLGIALPGLYATVLKLASGPNATLLHQPWLLLWAFVAWFIGVAAAFSALMPRQYRVDPDSLTQIEQFFNASARRKHRLLMLAGSCSFVGILLAVLSMLN